ncbi:unnamed protein product [Acanthoscelides obtectus]|uniref:Uncharacterized protein n=1 Tax=Acanthoscelides obtectus TaxID=200917 RepID=A0A9P0PBL8_ACAOB|nr:unnamed protein product [Acanthoscelides obtectus]CAK1680335.1 hypothetical protein AOBTE_LOCUS32584 [Acanthoscelides obtectus]
MDKNRDVLQDRTAVRTDDSVSPVKKGTPILKYCIMEKAGSKKRKRPEKSVIEEAVSEVLEKGQSINRTALALNISRAYLAKIVKKVKTSGDSSYEHCPNIGVFSQQNRRICLQII